MLFKTYALLKYFGLLLGISTAFLQPALFSRFLNQNEFAFLVFLFGITAYLVFFDFGLNKPIYAHMRQRYINNNDLRDEIPSFLGFYTLILILTSMLFAIVLILISSTYNHALSTAILILFSMTASLNLFLNYIESIFSALEQQIAFQKLDISRRIANLLSLFLLLYDQSFFLTILANTLSLVGCYIYVIYFFTKKFAIAFTPSHMQIKNIIYHYWPKGKDSLALTFNDTLIYNIGFLVLPFFTSPFSMIVYSLWMKPFFGGSLLIRIIIDIYIHDITKYYFSKSFNIAKELFLKAIFLSLFLACFYGIVLLIFSPILFSVWVDKSYSFSMMHYLAMFLWLGALAIQSTGGIFLLSQGNSFAYMRNVSTILMIVVSLSFVVFLKSGLQLDTILVIVGLINIIGSIFYLIKAISIIQNKGDI